VVVGYCAFDRVSYLFTVDVFNADVVTFEGSWELQDLRATACPRHCTPTASSPRNFWLHLTLCLSHCTPTSSSSSPGPNWLFKPALAN